MANSLFELLQQCTVSLKVGTSEGTGFFVAPGLILTCAHVIKGIRAEVNNEITVKWNNNNYTVIHQSDQQESNDCSLDLALLNLEFSEHPYVYLSEDVEPFDRLYSYGYSDYCPNGAPVTVLCEGLTGDNPKLIKFKGGQIRPGLSGSPVLNVRTGEVCGVITKTFDRGSDLGGEAITTTAILSRFPELEKLQKGNTFGLWANYLETETVRDRLHNLPNQNLPPQLTKFVGRYNQLEDLIKCLNQKNFITVGGIGGIGKTALVIEAAYRCLEARNSHQSESQIPQFDTIIFTSAKRKELDYSGTVDCSSVQSNLFDIFRVIANTLNFSLTTDESEDSRINNEEIIRNKVKQKLGQQHTLLIVDNFETIDEEEKHKLLVFLTRELPKSTVAVVTTRQELYIYTDVTLGCLSEKENLQLTQQELVPLLETRNISLNEEQISQINQTLYQHRRGHPLAIILDIRKLVTQLEDGGHLNWNLGNSKLFIKDDRHLEQALQEVLGQFEGAGNFSLKGEIEKLRGTPAHKLLMSLAIFKFPAVKDAIVKVAGIDEVNQAKVDEELKRLRQLFLVNLQHPKESQEKMRYWMLPFTQDYIVTQELTVDLNFRVAAEERWVKWYQDLASKYGGKDWEQWYINYDYIEQEWENLSAVLDWCASQKRISDVSNLWNYLNDYASLYGHWVKRLFWTEWLIKESSHDPEWPTKDTIHAMSSKGFTLIQMGRGDEAEKLLLDAWGLAQNKFPYVKDSVAKHLSYLYIRQGKYGEARQWLEHERCAIDELIKERDNLVQQLGIKITQIEESSEIDNTALIIKRNRINRSLINIDYYEGEICFQEKKYDQAELIFRKVVDEATQLKWTRRVNYAKHWLADIRIAQAEMEMQRDNFPGTGDFLSQARELLTKGYLHAELNHDQRRMANFQFSCARLEQLWADLEKKRKTPEEATVIYQEHHKKAIEWANLAIDSCTRLGMEADRKRIYNSFPCLANSQA